MPLFIKRTIRVKHHGRVISVSVVQVLVVGTTYKNMVNIEGRLVPLEEYLGN